MLWWTLRKLKSRDGNKRISAVEELGKNNDPRCFEHLVAALVDTDTDVRKVAATVLGRAGDTRAVEPLISLLKDKSTQRSRPECLQSSDKNSGKFRYTGS
jgi:HEAT repeat protein